MRHRLLVLVIVAQFWARPVLAQQNIKLAELMPAKTLAYAEVRHIGELTREVRTLFKPSVLGNVPDSLLKLRGQQDTISFGRVLGGFGLAFSPEVAAELGRLDGAAVAFTGISADHQPEFVAVILSGKSNVPGFFMRTFLSMAPARAVSTVEGVPMYRMQDRNFNPRQKPAEATRESGPVYAMTTDAVLIGSADNVKEVILRLKGKSPGPSLAEDANFQEARKQIEDLPGLFAYGNPAEMLPMLRKQMPQQVEHDTYFYDFLRLMNPRAVRAVVLGWGLKDGKLTYRKVALLDPKQTCPMLDILPTAAVDPALLHFAPRDTMLAAAIANQTGEQRWRKLLSDLDQVHPAGAKLPKPSEAIKQLETKLGVNLGKDVLARVRNAAVVIGNPLNAPIRKTEVKGPNFHSVGMEPEMPIAFILQAVDGKAAEQLEQLVPKLFGMGQKPVNENLHGRQLSCLKQRGQPMVYYGREGATLVLGPYGDPVAQSLNAGSKADGLLAEPLIANRLKQMNDRQALLLVKPIQVIGGGLAMMIFTRRSSASVMKSEPPTGPVPRAKETKPDESGCQNKLEKNPDAKVTTTVTIVKRSPEEEKFFQALNAIFAQEQMMIIGLKRSKDRIQLDGQVDDLRRFVPAITDFLVEQAFREEARRQKVFNGSDNKPSPP